MSGSVVHVLVVADHISAGSTPRDGVGPPMWDAPPVASTLPSGSSVRFRCVRANAIGAACCQTGEGPVASRTYVFALDAIVPPLSEGAERYELPAFMYCPGRYITPLPASRTVGSNVDQVCDATFSA